MTKKIFETFRQQTKLFTVFQKKKLITLQYMYMGTKPIGLIVQVVRFDRQLYSLYAVGTFSSMQQNAAV